MRSEGEVEGARARKHGLTVCWVRLEWVRDEPLLEPCEGGYSSVSVMADAEGEAAEGDECVVRALGRGPA